MISKEKFVEYMSAIKNAEEKDIKFDEAIRSLNNSGEGIAMLYTDEITIMIQMVCDLMDIEYNAHNCYGDIVQYFIYECEWGKKDVPIIIDSDDKEIILKTIEDLYDYVMMMRKRFPKQ